MHTTIDYRKGRFLRQRDSGGRFYRSPSFFIDHYLCLHFPSHCGLCCHQEERCSNNGHYEIWYKKDSFGNYERFLEN